MRNIQATYVRTLLAGVATIALAVPAFAADTKADARDARLNALEQKLDALLSEISELKKEAAADKAENAALQSQVVDLKRAQTAAYADVQAQRASDAKLTINNLRPTFTSADGKFSVALRSLVQFDSSYFIQDGRAASGTDLSSGTNFRRLRFGADGKAFGDWSYSVLIDFGGSGTEGARVADGYIQYDGFAPFHIRSGAFATPQGIDDQTSAADILFLERAGPADLARSLAGADGRKNFLNIFAYDTDYYVSAAWSAARAADPAVFDSQQALVGRAAYRVYKDANTNVLLSAGGNYIFKIPDAAASPAGASTITLQEGPENTVDGTRLITSGAINAKDVKTWGLEAAANLKNVYVQGGYFGYSVARRASTLPNPNFNGHYAQASWILTGESKPYNTATAAWGSPRPAKAVGSGGIGAFELVGRYSLTDLNFNEGLVGANTPAAAGAIRGGVQKGYTAGLNWYPNGVIRLLFDYQHLDINRIGTTTPFKQIGQDVDILTARAQLSF